MKVYKIQNIKLTIIFYFLFVSNFDAKTQIIEYGPVINTTSVSHLFQPLIGESTLNNNLLTTLIPGLNSSKPTTNFSTFVFDIGEHDGNKNCYEAPRIIVFNLWDDSFETIELQIKDDNNQLISMPNPIRPFKWGRIDEDKCVWGPNNKIYFTSYGGSNVSYPNINNGQTINNWLIEFDYVSRNAIAYPFPQLPVTNPNQQALYPFVVSVGPNTDNPPLVYGGTFGGSYLWWFNPTTEQIKVSSFELDPAQEYVHKIAGKDSWIYAILDKSAFNPDPTQNGTTIAKPTFAKSLYAYNIDKDEKYLLMHSNMDEFANLRTKINPASGQQDIYLNFVYVLNGIQQPIKKGTIYPTPIPLTTNESPCYNIDISDLNYAVAETCGFPGSPCNVLCPTGTVYNPPNCLCETNSIFASNGPYENLPDIHMMTTGQGNYLFQLDQHKIVTPGEYISSLSVFQDWTSYDPLFDIGVDQKPLVEWHEEDQALHYTFPQDGITLTIAPNDLREYNALLTGLSHIIGGDGSSWCYQWGNNSSFNFVNLAIVKAKQYGGLALIKPAHSNNPNLNYTYQHQPWGKLKGSVSDLFKITGFYKNLGYPSNCYTMNQLGTHLAASYPSGQIEIINYGETPNAQNCQSTHYSANNCNPRIIARMEQVIDKGLGLQYGPNKSIGAKIISITNDIIDPNFSDGICTPRPNKYKIYSVGTTGRKLDGNLTSIGIAEFDYDETTRNIVPHKHSITGNNVDIEYRIVDRLEYNYFSDYNPISIALESEPNYFFHDNASTDVYGRPFSNLKDGLGYVNTAYGANYSFDPIIVNTWILLNAKSSANFNKNILILFNPTTETIENKIAFPSQYQTSFIANLITVKDFYFATFENKLLIFKIDKKSNSINIISEFNIPNSTGNSYVSKAYIVTGIDGPDLDGESHKIFISYLSNNGWQVASVTIDATNNRQNYDFNINNFVVYSWPANHDPLPAGHSFEVLDFLHLPLDGDCRKADLIFVANTRLYYLSSIVDAMSPSGHIFNLYKNSNKALSSDKEDKELSIVTFPNPFSNQITVKTSNLPLGKYITKLMDISGRLIQKNEIVITTKKSINQILFNSTLTKGSYIFSIHSFSGKLIRSKIVVKN